MERNPKKSKALIITFIIVLLLLIAGYFAFKNSGSIFGTKSGTVSKIFAPLLGTSKGKNVTDIKTVDNGTGTSSTTTTDTTVIDTNNSNGNQVGSLGTGGQSNGGSVTQGTPPILPPFIPLPTPVSPSANCKDANGNSVPCTNDLPPPQSISQCADSVDNDGDKLADINDPGCHIDFNENNNLSYDSSINDESRKKDTSQTAVGGLCPDDPLVFTEDEKAQLAVLLRQYYLLAPTLRIEDDVTLLDYDNVTNEELVKQATILLKDCKDQKANPSYTGPKEVKDNPYYQSGGAQVTTGGGGTTGGGTSNSPVVCTPGYALINGVAYNQTNSIFVSSLIACTPNASSGSSAPLMEACMANYTTIGGFTYNGSLLTNNLRPCLTSVFPTGGGTSTPSGTTTTSGTSIGGPQYINGYGIYELMFNIW